MNSRPLLVIGAIVVLLLLGYAVYSMQGDTVTTETATTTMTGATTTPDTSPSATTGGAPASTNTSGSATGSTGTGPKHVTIVYGPNGFSPANVTIPVGGSVTWVNQGSTRMWVASAQHPTHTVYDGTSTSEHCTTSGPTSSMVFDQCGQAGSFTFTFTKAGTWGYHNHAQASDRGVITVTP